MISAAVYGNSLSTTSSSTVLRLNFSAARNRAYHPNISRTTLASLSFATETSTKKIVLDSLRVLEWDKLCDAVASFAGTSSGRNGIKKQLRSLDRTYEDSLSLLRETNAAVEMHSFGAMLEFISIDSFLVESAIRCAKRDSPVTAQEAVALAALLQFVEALQFNLKAAVKKDVECYQRFMPLSDRIMELVVNRSLIKFIQQLIDEDGSVKDTASSALRQSRDQVRSLENKLQDLLRSLIRNEMKGSSSSLELSDTGDRWCIMSSSKQQTTFDGLLLSSGSGSGSIIEPLSAVPLNDELQRARASVAKAEADVLLKITKKMQEDLSDIEIVLKNMIELDVINARARYSMSFGGSFPDLYLPPAKDISDAAGSFSKKAIPGVSHPTQMKWSLYLNKVSHPLLVQQHRQKLQKAKKDVSDAIAEIRRKRQGGTMPDKKETDLHISHLEQQVVEIKLAPPVPIDVHVGKDTRVIVITGPNTGGKTICLKTVGLAAMMAKSGLYVLASEPIKIPWFDNVYADIGDEQSLSQSLSTFSGHLRQISEILSQSTNLSLVLLDEVGAGTNPLEGAALGMSVLETFAESGPILTMATTHIGELKTLKYSNKAFENACMEFDETNLRPTYRILWGIPGRSNAINIAERLGLPKAILENARELYGVASAEINEIIVEMERFKQNFHKQTQEANHYLKLSKNLHEKLLLASKKISEHRSNQRDLMAQEVSQAAASARSMLHSKLRQVRVYNKDSQQQPSSTKPSVQHSVAGRSKETSTLAEASTTKDTKEPISAKRRVVIPKEGDKVIVRSLKREAVVLKVDLSREEVVVQAGNLKLKLKLADVS